MRRERIRTTIRSSPPRVRVEGAINAGETSSSRHDLDETQFRPYKTPRTFGKLVVASDGGRIMCWRGNPTGELCVVPSSAGKARHARTRPQERMAVVGIVGTTEVFPAMRSSRLSGSRQRRGQSSAIESGQSASARMDAVATGGLGGTWTTWIACWNEGNGGQQHCV